MAADAFLGTNWGRSIKLFQSHTHISKHKHSSPVQSRPIWESLQTWLGSYLVIHHHWQSSLCVNKTHVVGWGSIITYLQECLLSVLEGMTIRGRVDVYALVRYQWAIFAYRFCWSLPYSEGIILQWLSWGVQEIWTFGKDVFEKSCLLAFLAFMLTPWEHSVSVTPASKISFSWLQPALTDPTKDISSSSSM